MKALWVKDTLLVLSGLFTDLSAGWFGTIIIVPIFSKASLSEILTVNLPSAIVALVLAILLARKARDL